MHYPRPLPRSTLPASPLGGRPGTAGPTGAPPAAPTCVDPVVGLQLVLEAELLAAAVALVGLLAGVDALVALQRALVPEAAAAELALVGVVTCKHTRVVSEPPPCRAETGSPAWIYPRHPAPTAVPGYGAPQQPQHGTPVPARRGCSGPQQGRAKRPRAPRPSRPPSPIPRLLARHRWHRPGPGRLPCSRPGG